MTPAVDALEAAGLEFSVVEYDHDPANRNYGDEAAAETGAEPSQIFKTLLAVLSDGEIVVAVVPVTQMLDLKAAAKAAGAKKATLADQIVAQRRTGYVVGGISPFGQKQRHRTFVDNSAQLFESIFVSGGRRGLEVAVEPKAFVELLDATFVDLGG